MAQRTEEKRGRSESLETDEDGFGKKKRKAFLDLLLDLYDEGKIEREDIRSEVDTFMFEGHDTTAHGIMWALYVFARHPDIQAKARDEIKSILGFAFPSIPTSPVVQGGRRQCRRGRGDSSGPSEPDEVSGLLPEGIATYLALRPIRHTRTHPATQTWFPIPLAHSLSEHNLLLSDETYTLPAKTTVYINFLKLHRDAEFWPEPMKVLTHPSAAHRSRKLSQVSTWGG